MKDRATNLPGRQVTETTDNVGNTTTTVSANSGGFSSFTVIDDWTGARNRKVRHNHAFAKSLTLHHSGFTLNTPPAGSKSQSKTSGVGIRSFTSSGLTLSPGYNNAVYNEALSKLYGAMRGDIDLSIDLIQSRQTASMVSKGLRILRSATMELHKLRRFNPRDWGSAWLEYTYGLKPTMSTLYDGFKRIMTNEDGYHKLKATAQLVTKAQSSVNTDGITLKTLQTLQQRCRFEAEYNVRADRVAQLAGYTSLNPVSIAWEAIPYSFVADWFIDIGGYLRNMESAAVFAPSFLGGCVIEGYMLKSDATYGGVQSLGGGANHIESMSGMRFESGKRRAVLSSTPTPRPPTFQPSLGPSRLISAASLLSQHITSWKHK